jgi:hypothetical protein
VSFGVARTAPGKLSHAWPAVVGLVALYFGVFFLQSALEEIVCRGILWTLIGRTGRRVGQTLLITSAIFSLLHLGNPGANGLALVNIFLVGLLFGLARGHTQRLWLPFGMHSLWNFLEGSLFGFPVSGLTTFRVWATDLSGPTVWTGGKFGPEASAFTTALLLAAVGVWAALARKITAGPTGGGGGSTPSTTLRTGLAYLLGGPRREAPAEPGESVVTNEPDEEEPPPEESGRSQPCPDELASCGEPSPP